MLKYYWNHETIKMIIPYSRETLIEELITFIKGINKKNSEIYIVGGNSIYSISALERHQLHPYARVIQNSDSRQRIEFQHTISERDTNFYIFLGLINSLELDYSRSNCIYLLLFKDSIFYNQTSPSFLNYPQVNSNNPISHIFN